MDLAFVGAPSNPLNLKASHAVDVAASAPPASVAAPQSSATPWIACGAVASVAAVSLSGRKKQRKSAALVKGRKVVQPKFQPVARHALDQSSRYADLGMDEADLIKKGVHVLVAYIMKPKAGYDYLATAAHFAAESSTGTNVNV